MKTFGFVLFTASPTMNQILPGNRVRKGRDWSTPAFGRTTLFRVFFSSICPLKVFDHQDAIRMCQLDLWTPSHPLLFVFVAELHDGEIKI